MDSIIEKNLKTFAKGFMDQQSKLAELEQENKKLKEYNRRLKQGNDDLRKQNSYRNKIVDIIPQDEKSVSEETIKDLQERIRFLEESLDRKEKVNKSLREENKRLSDFLECEA